MRRKLFSFVSVMEYSKKFRDLPGDTDDKKLKIHIPSHTLSLRRTVYLHGPHPPHPDEKSRNENDAQRTAIPITIVFLKESIAIFKELRRKTTKNTKMCKAQLSGIWNHA